MGKAGIARRACSSIRLLYQMDTAIAPGDLGHDVGCLVARTVIDDDRLPACMLLRTQAVQRSPDRLTRIVSRNDNRNIGHEHSASALVAIIFGITVCRSEFNPSSLTHRGKF
jgi:hypothetical protein